MTSKINPPGDVRAHKHKSRITLPFNIQDTNAAKDNYYQGKFSFAI